MVKFRSIFSYLSYFLCLLHQPTFLLYRTVLGSIRFFCLQTLSLTPNLLFSLCLTNFIWQNRFLILLLNFNLLKTFPCKSHHLLSVLKTFWMLSLDLHFNLFYKYFTLFFYSFFVLIFHEEEALAKNNFAWFLQLCLSLFCLVNAKLLADQALKERLQVFRWREFFWR
jgi:hypothetical protein